jgi:hypothetical protein
MDKLASGDRVFYYYANCSSFKRNKIVASGRVKAVEDTKAKADKKMYVEWDKFAGYDDCYAD